MQHSCIREINSRLWQCNYQSFVFCSTVFWHWPESGVRHNKWVNYLDKVLQNVCLLLFHILLHLLIRSPMWVFVNKSAAILWWIRYSSNPMIPRLVHAMTKHGQCCSDVITCKLLFFFRICCQESPPSYFLYSLLVQTKLKALFSYECLYMQHRNTLKFDTNWTWIEFITLNLSYGLSKMYNIFTCVFLYL